ncbi:uncharacterized protein LOC123269702 [Cotesia glomerata]|uniref:uncharacterized protein LOC123269702 n=1 Tax=Cotesia glomerata TaxID=32391 RepID=UPI001D00FA5F|nr:uncharacterized protein LOC123269702 [Cotesia glomerata]
MNYKFKVLLNSTDISDRTWVNVVQIGGSDGLVIVNVYRSPNSRVSQFKVNMVDLFENYIDKGKLIIVGDFNLDVGSVKDRYARKFVDECTLMGLNQLIKVPTRSTLTSDTIIDLVFSNFDLCTEVNYKKLDQDLFFDVFTDKFKSNGQIKNSDVVEVLLEQFNSSVIDALDVVIPKTEIICKSKPYKGWITEDLVKKMKDRDRLFYISKNSGLEEDIKNYKRIRNDILDELRKCKRAYNDKNIDENRNDGKILWRRLQELIGSKKDQNVIDSIELDGKILTDSLTISNEFNHDFVDSIDKIVKDIGYVSIDGRSNNYSNDQKWDRFDELDENKVDKIIKNLDDNKGYNNDINSVILKYIWNFNRNIILNIMKRSLMSGVVPNSIKISTIVPIQKIKNSIKISDFRPINPLPVIEQILESIVKEQLEKFIDMNKILNEEQSGFRKEHSCETAMQCSLIDWRNNIDKGLYIGVVFIDFSRAFETINRNELLILLGKWGIGGVVLNWFKSYLKDRKQVVKFNDSISEKLDVEHGVPQGSKLGPLLFILYINEIINLMKEQGAVCRLFADDMKIYFASKNVKEIEYILNKCLNILEIWLKKHQLKINVKKTVFMMLHDVRKEYEMGS